MADLAARVTVTGTGTASIPPDVARAVLVAEATRPSAADARTETATIATRVLDALRGAGVAPEDLRTAGLDVSPAWEHDGSRMVRTGFTVTNRIAVTVRDLEAVGRVLDAGLDAGATGLDGVTFGLLDESAAREEARRAAVADARRRAATIADALGGRLRTLVAVSEGGVAAPFQPQARMMAMAADSGATPTPVRPGEVQVTVSVTAEWELLGA
jgi:uncharacterized protein YggE